MIGRLSLFLWEIILLMKPIGLVVFFILCFISGNLFAQSPKVIEADLLKSFTKIEYWGDPKHRYDEKINGEDSLLRVNEIFGKKLFYYTSKYPFTIGQKFLILKKNHLDICTSSDGLIRIYSWDTQTGGTMHFFDDVIQFKSGNRTKSLLDTPRSQGDAGADYRKIYTFKNNGVKYYLCVFMFIESSSYDGEDIMFFSIENNSLKQNIKLIKTNEGLTDYLGYEYDNGSIIDWKPRPEIYFDPKSKTIHLPLVKPHGQLTYKFITYKFTGQYFEKVKN
jgi:hypothetical protein